MKKNKEKYYKIKKDIAARGGFNEHMREVVDEDYLVLSEIDLGMISLSLSEKLRFLQAKEVSEADVKMMKKRILKQRKERVEKNGN